MTGDGGHESVVHGYVLRHDPVHSARRYALSGTSGWMGSRASTVLSPEPALVWPGCWLGSACRADVGLDLPTPSNYDKPRYYNSTYLDGGILCTSAVYGYNRLRRS